MAWWISDVIKPISVLDIGCGDGKLVYAIASHGIDVIGVDIKEDSSHKFLLETQDVLHLEGRYQRDLVICLEVAEYVDPQDSINLVHQIANSLLHGGTLLWAAGDIGQDGIGRINCRTVSFWKTELENAGLEYDQFTTIDCKKYFTQYANIDWFADNVLVFKKSKKIGHIEDGLNL